MSEPRPIEAHHAYVFDCEECGAENFVRAIREELTEEEMQQHREALGIDEDVGLGMEVVPDVVTCHRCGIKYAPFQYMQGPEVL